MTRWEHESQGVHAFVPSAVRDLALRAASVTLPTHANEHVRVTDDQTGLAVAFRLAGASDESVELVGGLAIYRGAFAGADVVHRVHAEGTEDFIAFEKHPTREEVRYIVDVSHISGLRLVSRTLEFLDAHGTPRLRIAPPYVVDRGGRRSPATLAIEGCSFDGDAAAPWDRPITPPGAATCEVVVRWQDVTYPFLVDPAWTTTGSMATARGEHTATLLSTGKALIAGGYDATGIPTASAELFDGTSAFAATGAMKDGRCKHVAALLPSGKVLIAGGYDASGTSLPLERFDGVGTFTSGASFNNAVGISATPLVSGKVLLAGGTLFGTATGNGAYLYDETTSTVSKIASMLSAHEEGHTATRLPSGKVLIAGGVAAAELFDGTGTFTGLPAMKASRLFHAAALLPSGKVLLTGGDPASLTAELFDGAAFASTGTPTAARNGHTATVLASAKVLIAGGGTYTSSTGAFGSSATAEVFDGASSFLATGTLGSVHTRHTATLLPSGKVLITGSGKGYLTGLGGASTSAELFQIGGAGIACATAGDCTTGICVDGVCCDTTCTGACSACDVASKAGTCSPVSGAPHGSRTVSCGAFANTCVAGACATSCTTDIDCASGRYCEGGSCLATKVLKSACSTNHECQSTFCADGYCCDTACANRCGACNVPTKIGTCTATSGTPVGARPACTGTGVGTACGQTCDGIDLDACHYPSASSACGVDSCSGGTATHTSFCDGAGKCGDVRRPAASTRAVRRAARRPARSRPTARRDTFAAERPACPSPGSVRPAPPAAVLPRSFAPTKSAAASLRARPGALARRARASASGTTAPRARRTASAPVATASTECAATSPAPGSARHVI